jgi:hypothetical protein
VDPDPVPQPCCLVYTGSLSIEWEGGEDTSSVHLYSVLCQHKPLRTAAVLGHLVFNETSCESIPRVATLEMLDKRYFAHDEFFFLSVFLVHCFKFCMYESVIPRLFLELDSGNYLQ